MGTAAGGQRPAGPGVGSAPAAPRSGRPAPPGGRLPRSPPARPRCYTNSGPPRSPSGARLSRPRACPQRHPGLLPTRPGASNRGRRSPGRRPFSSAVEEARPSPGCVEPEAKARFLARLGRERALPGNRGPREGDACRAASGVPDCGQPGSGAGMVKARGPAAARAPRAPAPDAGPVRKPRRKKRAWRSKAREAGGAPGNDPGVVAVRPPKAPEDFSPNWKALQEASPRGAYGRRGGRCVGPGGRAGWSGPGEQSRSQRPERVGCGTAEAACRGPC